MIPAPLTLVEWATSVWPVERPGAQPSPAFFLPAALFVGRRRELAELGELVKRTRLVTLTGAAGSGKTRLALEVARRTASAKPDGPSLIELASLSEAESLPDAFATALEIKAAQPRLVTDLLLERLASFDGLVVVDNCEHMVEACAALIDRLLRRCPKLSILATSREPLRVDGENVWPVSTLSVPSDTAPAVEVRRAEAVVLFVERARQVSPRFELNASNVDDVAAICRRLDGLPLAIELAASRTSFMDVGSIAGQLTDRFRFLTSGFRNAPPRQKTLRAAVDWSYDLLTAAERQLFARLSVFAGGFDVAAAISIGPGGAVLAGQVLDLLGHLVDKSLVVAVNIDAASVRYRLLETLRAYGLDRLRDEGELETYRRRHAEYLASLGNGSVAQWDSSEWLDRMQWEIDNFRDALGWSRGTDPALHLSLASAYGWFCVRSGFIAEGRTWLERALDRGVSDRAARARAGETLAMLAWRCLDVEAADRFASDAVRLQREIGDESAIGWSLGTLAFVRIATHKAESTGQEMITIARQLHDPRMEAEALNILGLVKLDTDLDAALDHMQQSLVLFETAGPEPVPPGLLNGLGWALLRLGRAAEACPFVERGLTTRLVRRDVTDMSASLDALAEIAFQMGDPVRAMRLKGAADAIRDRAGSVPNKQVEASRERWVHRAERVKGTHAAWIEGSRMTPQEAGDYALTPLSKMTPRHVVPGESALTTREMEVARLVADGLSNDEIAGRLRLSSRTVEAHLDHIRPKLGARSRVEVATWVTAGAAPPRASPS
jgi:predicted ATPase/DNA-binding CsgD family transcriptional regulator